MTLVNAKVSIATLKAAIVRHCHTDGISGILTHTNTYQIQMFTLQKRWEEREQRSTAKLKGALSWRFCRFLV